MLGKQVTTLHQLPWAHGPTSLCSLLVPSLLCPPHLPLAGAGGCSRPPAVQGHPHFRILDFITSVSRVPARSRACGLHGWAWTPWDSPSLWP